MHGQTYETSLSLSSSIKKNRTILSFRYSWSSFSHDLQNKLSYQSIEQCYVAQTARASYPGLSLAACPLIPDIKDQDV